MYMMYIVRRTQIYLDDAQHERLGRRARAARTTTSDLIREAVDAYLGPDDKQTQLLAFRAAVRAVAGSSPRLPKGRRYVDEIRRGDVDRERDLEERRSK
jgi:hypothetical protein